MTSQQKTWTLGGIALIACGVIGMLQSTLPAIPGLFWPALLNNVLYAVALLLFAIGLSPEASVVERRPLGMIALIVLGAWPITIYGLAQLFTSVAPLSPDGWQMLSYIAIVLPTAAATIGTLQIVRSAVVPGRARWLPLWAFGLYALAWGLPQIVTFVVGPLRTLSFGPFFAGLALLAFLASTIGLGIAALIVAAQQKTTQPAGGSFRR